MKGYLLGILLLCSGHVLNAKSVSHSDIFTVANNFLLVQTQTGFAANTTISDLDTLSDDDTRDILAYIFHLKPRGFLIISADNRMQPVIAYSFRHNWQGNEKALLFQFVKKDLKLRLLRIGRDTAVHSQWNRYIRPQTITAFQQWPPEDFTQTGGWLATAWHQGDPYNQLCPLLHGTEKRSPVGCLALTLAQIINYHRYIGNCNLTPNDVYIGINLNGTRFIDADSSAFDFPSFTRLNSCLQSIRDKYKGHDTLSDNEIAALCFTCGILTQTQYSYNVSSAYYGSVLEVLNRKFNYYSAEFSNNITNKYPALQENIKNGLPAIIGVASDDLTGNHALIADGYNTEDFYHLNFGWGEASPDSIVYAWYHLPRTNVRGYNIVETMVLNIRPFNISVSKPVLNLRGTAVGSQTNPQSLRISTNSKSEINIEKIETSEHFFIYRDGLLINSLENINLTADIPLSLDIVCQPDSIGMFKGSLSLTIDNEPAGMMYKYTSLIAFGIPDNGTYVDSIASHTVWSKQNSPYCVCTSISVASGYQLEIMPGAEVLFMDACSLKIEDGGKIIARGSEKTPIDFHPLNGT